MKILVEISGDSFDKLLSHYDFSSEEYERLIDGVVNLKGGPNGWRTVSICCDEFVVASLLAVAKRADPRAASDIAKSIALGREL
jgi:hypothetical protein